ncbi:hypothetical protein L3081_24405 [Colwellia sp. MSW7]|jgi:hypothetical protein|uniref:Uncharacterized protein n=1 Tax=Colwellia maritima TaxID=2912588 RepID=A0ABS9X859_9GAMM|nr:hypothetical protein [Colwellia maritima]MCI2285972.1 hypothetical protein [Colwellia maritima]
MNNKIHYLTGVLFINEKNIMLCVDQFGNEAALHQDGEFSEWHLSNYITRNDDVLITSPSSCYFWELKKYPEGYDGTRIVSNCY